MTVGSYQKHSTIYKMDYIDRYRQARRNKFATDEDKKIQREFPDLVLKDVEWAKKNNLIRGLNFEEYMEQQEKQRYTQITPEMRKVITLEDPKIPSWIIGQYYDIPPTTVNNIRAKAIAKKRRERESC